MGECPYKGRKHILIVDDDALTSLALMKTLEAKDRTIETMTRGPRAFDGIRSRRYDLVFLEIGFFDQPGIAFLKEMSISDPDIRIVVTTASIPDGEIESAVTGHGHFLLPKPFECFTARTIAAEILEEKRKRKSAPPYPQNGTWKKRTEKTYKEI